MRSSRSATSARSRVARLMLATVFTTACAADPAATAPGPDGTGSDADDLRGRTSSRLATARAVGFNGAGFFETLGPRGSASYEQGVAALESLRATITLRLPGGAISRFHNPARVRRGWGLDESAIRAFYATYGADAEELTDDGMDKWLADAQAQPDYSYLDEVVALSRRLDLRVVYVLNVLTGTADDNMAALHELRDQGVQVIGVEAGNEVYGKYASFAAYAAIVEPLFARIATELPGVRRSYVAAPESGRSLHTTWNDALAAHLASHRGSAEAVTLHPYATSSAMPDCYAQYDAWAAGVRHAATPLSFATPEPGLDAAHRCARAALRTFAGSELDTLMTATNRYNVPEVWFTEWNIKPSDTFGNTLTQAMFHLEYRVRTRANDRLRVFTVHNGVAPDIFGLLSNSREIDATDTPLVVRAGFYAAQLAQSLERPTMRPRVFTAPAGAAAESVLGTFTDGLETVVYFANDHATPVSLDVHTLGPNAVVRYLQGQQLYSSAGHTAALQAHGYEKAHPRGVELAALAEQPYAGVLPSMSLGVITVRGGAPIASDAVTPARD